MQAPYPLQDADTCEASKSGTNVHECRICVNSDAFDRFRGDFQVRGTHFKRATGASGAPGWGMVLLAQAHAVEGCQAERADLEVMHFLAHRLEHRRVGDRGDRNLFLEDFLRLLVELDPLVMIAAELGFL